MGLSGDGQDLDRILANKTGIEQFKAHIAYLIGHGETLLKSSHGDRRTVDDPEISKITEEDRLCTGGDIRLEGVDYRHLSAVATMLRQAGCRLTCGETSIRLQAPRRLQSAGPIRTAPYPGFPTDAQAVLMASLLRSEGATVFVENIFDSRYRHVPEMVRMGADIRLEGRVAVVCGVDRLHGAAVRAKELRGGASLVLAGLQAEGETTVTGVEHIQRGYEDLTGELAQLGADIRQEER